ncbi:hypothetical protein D3C87_1303170 [compost metagenome]
MVAHQQNRFVPEQAADPLRLITQAHAVKTIVDDHSLEKAHAVLLDRLQPRIRQTRQRCRVFRMGVQDATGVRLVAVQGAVQGPRGDVRRVGAVEAGGLIGVDQQQVAGLDPREMLAVRIDQKLPTVPRDRHAEVIGDGLVQVQPRGPAKRAGQADSQLLDRLIHPVLHRC